MIKINMSKEWKMVTFTLISMLVGCILILTVHNLINFESLSTKTRSLIGLAEAMGYGFLFLFLVLKIFYNNKNK